MSDVKVFEKGSGKWVKQCGTDTTYSSNESDATIFDIRALVEVSRLTDFQVFKRTMIAVPVNGNMSIIDCGTVQEYLNDNKNISDYQTYGV